MTSIQKRAFGVFFALIILLIIASGYKGNKWAFAKCDGKNCLENQEEEYLKELSSKWACWQCNSTGIVEEWSDKWTEIVTGTRLNADFVPGMVTVFYGKDLEARGVRKVWEALSLVPGIDISIARDGFPRTLIRGTGTVYSSANIKILLDNIPLTTMIGLSPVIKMPIEQVERIEVIRGPGTPIHGEFALSGVINIITYKDKNRVYNTLGIYDTYGLGGIFSWQNPQENLKLNLNLAGWETDGADIKTGPDTLYGRGMESISNAPGTTNEKMDYKAGLFTLNLKNSFSLNFQWIESGQGDFFGIGYALPPPSKNIIFKQRQWGVTGTQSINLLPSLHAKLILGWQEQKFEGGKGYFYPPGYTLQPPIGPPIVYSDGWTYEFNYEEALFRSGVDLIWKGWDRHRVLFKLSFSKTYLNDIWLESNIDFSTPTSIPFPLSIPVREYSNGKERKMTSLVLQDEFRIYEKLTLTATLRNDDYNDIGNNFFPRIAAVYRMDKHNILKTQYARAFRPTTFIEIYAPTNPIIKSSADLKPETIDSYEAGYIYRDFDTVGRITFFYSEFKDRIYEDINTLSYENSENMYLRGAEFELEQKLNSYLIVETNLSFVKTKDQNQQTVIQAANWLSNIGIIYKYNDKLTLSGQYRYVGDRKREALDPRNDIQEYHTVDITGTVLDLGLRGLTLRMSIKNLFDEDIRFPSPMERYWPFGSPYPTYPEDFPRPGRQWYLHLYYEF